MHVNVLPLFFLAAATVGGSEPLGITIDAKVELCNIGDRKTTSDHRSKEKGFRLQYYVLVLLLVHVHKMVRGHLTPTVT